MVNATWKTDDGRFALSVERSAAGLQVRQCTWLHSGATLDEVFVIHSLADFQQWFANSSTRFDHPIAHEEVRRFAHGTLGR